MKVLYIGHFNQTHSGWGRACKEHALALDSAGVDVVCRSIHLNSDTEIKDENLLRLIEKDIEGSDYCIQHVLPNFLSYNSSYKKNISYFVTETLDWNHSGFHNYINLMDELWMPNQEAVENAKKFVKKPIKVVPHPTDTAKYNKKYKGVDIPELNSGYNFYTIAEWNKRKRIGLIVQAFTLEFKKTEPVNLCLKINKNGVHPNQLGVEIQDFCKKIKSATKLYKRPEFYPNEIIMSSYLSEEELMGLHQSCHCFINSSYGEAWNYPCFDAMAMGNAIISPMIGGPKDFLKNYAKDFPLRGSYKPVFGMENENFSNYNSSRESWFEADLEDLRHKMRTVYNAWDGNYYSKSSSAKIVENYSRQNIGKLMKELLDV